MCNDRWYILTVYFWPSTVKLPAFKQAHKWVFLMWQWWKEHIGDTDCAVTLYTHTVECVYVCVCL